MLEKLIKKLFRCPVWGFCCSPFAFLFKLIVNNRNQRFDNGRITPVQLDAGVISVGNITVGGSGKTPFVDLLARHLKEKGFHPAILSRGYGRKSEGIVIVSDGKKVAVTPEIGGDEPVLLAKRLPGVPVIVGSERSKTGQRVINRFGNDVLILDDAFQHRRLQRDLDLVVLDASDPWGNGRLLPAGPLREPLFSLKRADGILLSKINDDIDSELLLNKIKQHTDALILLSKYLPSNWVSLADQVQFPASYLKNKKAVAFAGIGNPDHFQNTLTDLNVQVADFIVYKDHHWYSEKDIIRIIRKAEQASVDFLVTTEKDSVKLSFLQELTIPLFYLKMDLEIINGIEELQNLLNPVLKRRQRKGG